MKTETFSVPEVSCQHCVTAITQEVSAIPGVQQVTVDLTDKLVTVAHAPEIPTAQIIAAIQEAGYEQVSTQV